MSGESAAQILSINEEYILRFLHFLVMGLDRSLALDLQKQFSPSMSTRICIKEFVHR